MLLVINWYYLEIELPKYSKESQRWPAYYDLDSFVVTKLVKCFSLLVKLLSRNNDTFTGQDYSFLHPN